jgi:MoxR-vWA-beta-propeller ternary system domain bpX5
MGVVGVGAIARHLFEHLTTALADDTRRESTERLMATAHSDMLIVTGAADALPWVDGVRYIAPRADAPALWLPTHERPDVPLDLLALACARRHPQTPLLLWPSPAQLVPLQRALRVNAGLLARIRMRWERA